MDLLVVGIDGGTKAIVEGMPMPFTQELFSRSSSRLLEEDLLSRGWAEILTGEHASQNLAYYQMPIANGSHDFSCSYSKKEMVEAVAAPPLWLALNQAGTSVGFMNVPTSGPADEVDGFLVAGGGGGMKVGAGIPASMVHPSTYLPMLRGREYVQDVRLPGGETTVSGFIGRIRDAELVQTNAFIDMCEGERPKFGFFCFRMATEIQYLARYEIQRCVDERKSAIKRDETYRPENTVQASLLEYYSCLDDNIRRIFERLSPEAHIFVGDHSTEVFEYEANIDVWLEQAGYLKRMSFIEQKIRSAVRKSRRKITRVKARAMRGRVPQPSRIRRPLTPFSSARTKAFGTFYDTGNFAGVYINDRLRFGGPVKSAYTQESLVDEICHKLNEATIAKEHGLHAEPLRRHYSDATYGNLMPDIQIGKPDNVYFSSRHWESTRRNSALEPQKESLAGVKFPHTGVKGRNPLFVFSRQLKDHIEAGDPNDLRLVYRLICRHFQKSS